MDGSGTYSHEGSMTVAHGNKSPCRNFVAGGTGGSSPPRAATPNATTPRTAMAPRASTPTTLPQWRQQPQSCVVATRGVVPVGITAGPEQQQVTAVSPTL